MEKTKHVNNFGIDQNGALRQFTFILKKYQYYLYSQAQEWPQGNLW
jgi:hypothetical protein